MEEARRRKPGKQRRAQERRRHRRYAVPCKVRARALAPLGFPKARKSVIQGRMQNTSTGGLCLLTNDAIRVSYLLQCEIGIPKSAAAIPTLAQVRWIQKNAEGSRSRVGLQFLL